jgi:tetratricopeptide (TPR) repeat protein
VNVFVQVHSRQRGKFGGFFAKLVMRVYTLIVARVFLAGCLLGLLLGAQPPTPPPKDQKKLQTPPPKPLEEEPPEEDESLLPKEYALNPLESARNITAGNYYFKKGNFRAASRRYLEATRWDPSSVEAFLKLGESDEKIRDLAGARDAYTKYLALAPDAKNAEQIKKKIAKWPEKK